MAGSSRPRVYLAGPDVFLPEAEAWAEERKKICARHGLIGVSPFDLVAGADAAGAVLPEWQRIFLGNEAHIRGADAVIANLTPFRGPSADPGTVYEIGLMRGLGRPVFGYATTTQGFVARTSAVWGPVRRDAAGVWRDRDSLSVEDFYLFDNLMIVGGLTLPLVAEELPQTRRWTDSSVFERCVMAAAQALAAG